MRTLWPVAAIFFISIATFASLAGEEQLKEPAKPGKDTATVKWQDDEAGQFVFFAVLEGLYKDGVSSEVVKLIVDPPRDLDNKVKHVFVIQCDICHAAFEAFVLYSRRQQFQQSGGKDTFGKGIPEGIAKDLKSENAFTRVMALGSLIKPWIVARAEQMKLTKEKQEELIKKLMSFREAADKKLASLRQSDPLYKNWDFYGGCQACESAIGLSNLLNKDDKK